MLNTNSDGIIILKLIKHNLPKITYNVHIISFFLDCESCYDFILSPT